MFKNLHCLNLNMKNKSFYAGVWITLFAAIIPLILFFQGAPIGVPFFLVSSILGIGIGFYSLRVIHRHYKFFRGEWIVIPSIIVCSFILSVSLILSALLLFVLAEKPIQIDTKEQALNYAIGLAHENVSNMNPNIFLHDVVDFASLHPEFEINKSAIYTVYWEQQSKGGIIRSCGVTFGNDGSVFEEFACIIR